MEHDWDTERDTMTNSLLSVINGRKSMGVHLPLNVCIYIERWNYDFKNLVGLALREQILPVQSIPMDPHDTRMNGILTPDTLHEIETFK